MVQTGLGNGDKEQTRGWSYSLAVEELSVNLRQELRVRRHNCENRRHSRYFKQGV